MRFQVLGPLEVEADDGPVVLGGPKERLLLALLLARPNQVASVEALIRGLWGEQPPPTAAKTLQSHVKRLRRALEPGRARGAAGQVLVTREPGYLLRVAPGALDAARFEELTAQARRALDSGAAGTAASLLREALGLWRGQAFEEFLDSDVAVAESDRLAELRLVALEDRVEADLRLGRHRELVAELEGLVKEQPLRERLWAQLLLALYRSGRQADALLAYQQARSVLVEELGIDPGTELRRLHAAVLAQDPGLDLPLTVEAAGTRELPDPLKVAGPPFVGRAAELAWLRAAWTQATHGRGGVRLVAGGQGIGKTRLAAEFAREVHDRGGWVLYGRCTPELDDPLQPFTQALARVGVSLQDLSVADPGRSPVAFGEELVSLLTGRLDTAVLLVVDDLQLAQPPGLEALAALVTAGATQRLLVLGAHRQEEAPPALAALAERLDPGGAACRRLGPLDQDEVAQVLALYGSEPAARAAAGAVLDDTGGVPLLVHQAAGDWAQARAAHQVEEAARQTASSRSQLRVVQSRLADDLADLQELREHTEQVARLATGQGQPGEEQADDRPAAVVCPYKGLARFEPDDAGFFFGRERLVAELVTHLVGAGLVGVVGPSGSGKSSLVRAGLLPALADGVLPGSDRWGQLIIRPGEHPMRELGLALGVGDWIPAATADDDGGAAIGDDEQAGGGPVLGRAGGNLLLAAAAAAPERLLLVVDQFEEVFTACHDEAERAAFLAALVEGAQAPDGPVTVVVAVRADYYGHCAADPRLARLLAANHVLVGPMDQNELRRAIELPARPAGLRLEPGLADAMLGEAAQEPGGLPLLSCALLESWERRRGHTLTLAAYQQAGGVRGAVARLAERTWQQLDPEQQTVARRVLLRLAGPGEGEQVVRRRVPLDEVTPTGDERASQVVDALADRRLLTKSQDAVEVAHEALLREWPRLRGWLEEDVQGRALHRHLIGAAREWDQSGRDPGELYRGARLTGALDWVRDHHADLNQLERAFLDASRDAAEQEVADARRRADQEALRARREAGISRRLRAALAGLAVVLVLALVAGGLALTLRGQAERQALVADSGRLGAQALLADELDRSLLLARQGIALDDSLETRSDLLAALLRSPAATAILRGDLDGIGALGLSRDGRLLAVGDGDGTMAIYDVRERRLLQEKFQGHDQVDDLEFSPDRSLLAVATTGFSEPVRLWDVRGARIRHTLARADNDHVVTGVEFSPDGQTLATLSVDKDAEVGKGNAFLSRWDVGSGRRLKGPVRVSSHGGDALLASPDGARLVVVNGTETLVLAAGSFRRLRRFPHELAQPRVFVAALSPRDGRTLALRPDDGPIRFLDLRSGRRRVGGRHEGAAWSVRFSFDGKTLATGGGDGSVKVWDVASGQLRETFQGHEARVLGLVFSPDGHALYSAGSKTVIAWDLEGARRLGRPVSLFTGPIPSSFRNFASPRNALAISSDGALLAAPVASAPDHLALLDLRSPQQARRPLAPGIGRISAVAFSPDGKRLAVGSEAAPAPVLLDVASGRVVRRMTGGGHRGGIVSMRFDPKGPRLATGGYLQAIVWDTATGRPIRQLQHPTTNEQQEVSVGWSPDGSTLATGGGGGRVILWHTSTWQQTTTLPADTSLVLCVAFSPDGSLLAAGGAGDRSVTLWNVATRKLVGRLPHPIFVGSMGFDPDGRTLATSAIDDKVRLWDLASLRQIGVALPGAENGSGTNVSAFDPSGTHLIALHDSGTALVWDMNPDRWKQQACAVVGRSLTPEEWHELLPDRRYQPTCR
jgi:WD40 repeat protein/DNA-binding SARP family transcriptional activator